LKSVSRQPAHLSSYKKYSGIPIYQEGFAMFFSCDDKFASDLHHRCAVHQKQFTSQDIRAFADK
jgi:hypothetical protein